MSDQAPGSKLSRRLMSRSGGGLYRRSMADGGEVYTGPAAREALKALGARAFTMDQTIIVDENFDTSNADDMALYAHEVHHQMESGGMDDHGEHDAEEVAARAIERMVLHRAADGEDAATIMRDVRGGAAERGSYLRTPPKGGRQTEDESRGEAILAYEALMQQGVPYEIIIRDLTRYVIDQMNKTRESTTNRKSKHEGF